MNNIYIVGFMGTGKTTVASFLAKKLNRGFVDMDVAIEEDQGKSITNIFADSGEAHFRRLEQELLRELSAKSDLVISCGGGLICNEDNLGILKESGVVVSLSAKASTIHERTKHKIHRPLLNTKDPLAVIERLLVARKPYYEQADYTVDTDKLDPEGVVYKIIELLKLTNG
ncbi:MAG: shikimate kinase [Candidatus Omnitrophica bacterium]|nr:shikimate kinase [Candidatus Omnitrophota bacterium]